MPTATARYTGLDAGSKPDSLSDNAKGFLRDLHSQFAVVTDQPACDRCDDFVGPVPWGDRGYDFVQSVCAEVHWASAELQAQQHDLTKSEMRAEHAGLLKPLYAAREKAQRLSIDYRRLYPANLDLVAILDNAIAAIEPVEDKIDEMPNVRKPADKHRSLLLELAIRVLRIVKSHGISVTATADVDIDSASPAIRILQTIGDDLDMVRSPVTWRDIVIDAQELAPDLTK
jgi:hypothetical protein